MEKYMQNHLCVKIQYPEYMKNSYNSKIITQIKQSSNNRNGLFFKEYIQIAKKHKKRCPTLLAIRSLQIKI